MISGADWVIRSNSELDTNIKLVSILYICGKWQAKSSLSSVIPILHPIVLSLMTTEPHNSCCSHTKQ